jgi:hypothetical protein
MFTIFLQTLQELTPTHWISFAALLVSLTSLTVSALGYFRDSPRLRIEARRCLSDQQDESLGYVEVKAVNVGRRPIFLVMLWGRDSSGVGSGKYLDYEGPGIRLGENEFKTFKITHLPRGKDQFDAVGMGEDDLIEFEQMSIEDSLGKRHKIPKMKVLLPALRADYKDWCERTGYWKTPPPASTQPAADV